MVSPARTGASQRMLSSPGEPRLAERSTYLSTISRIAIDAGVPAAGDEALEEGVLRGGRVDVEGLRVELARKVDDFLPR